MDVEAVEGGSKKVTEGRQSSAVCPHCNLTYFLVAIQEVTAPSEPGVRRPADQVGVAGQSVGAYMRGDSGRIWGDLNLNMLV